MGFSKMKKSGRVVGLDLSTNCIAYSLFVDGELSEWGRWEFTGTTDDRLKQASRVARQLGLRLKPDKVVYEAAAYVNNRKTVIVLAQFYGAIVSAISQPNTVIRSVPAITWQNAIGNKALTKAEKAKIRLNSPDKSATWYKAAERDYRKKRTILWVRDTYGVCLTDDDVADAIALTIGEI